MMMCLDCGADLHWIPPILGRCWDCHRALMRKTEPWMGPAKEPTNYEPPMDYEEQARESEEWRAALREAWAARAAEK